MIEINLSVLDLWLCVICGFFVSLWHAISPLIELIATLCLIPIYPIIIGVIWVWEQIKEKVTRI